MKHTVRLFTFLSLVIAAFSWTVAAPNELTDRLQDEANRLDQTGEINSPPDRVQQLAKKFGVPEARVATMRAENKGWGAIQTELALAQALARKDPAVYPTTADALVRVQEMRSQKLGYGRIAQDLGFKLGPIISNVQRSDRATRRAHNPSKEKPHGDKHAGDHPDMSYDRPDKPAKADHPEHPAKPEKPDNPGRGKAH
jgi:hypothetical protein